VQRALVADIGPTLRFAKTTTPTVTTKGRARPHRLRREGPAQFLKKLEAAGVRIDQPFTPSPLGGGLAFIYDRGALYRAQQRPNPL
jgi:hypothetical protein